jgi:hypothetical protein
MKSTMLAFAIVASTLTAPIVSAQQTSAPEGSAVSMDKQLSQMQEHMKEMQQQLAKLRAPPTRMNAGS